MTTPQGTRTIFADQLRREVEAILEDLIFERSPMQTRLLRFLVEATIRGGPAPGQYEIAVDGLGRDPDFDLANDSYPRVHVSRLRSNLENYYARNRPVNGTRVVIRPGRYTLDLIRSDAGASQGRIASVTSDMAQFHETRFHEAQFHEAPEREADTVGHDPEAAGWLDYALGEVDDPHAPPLTPAGRRWQRRARSSIRMVLVLGSISALLMIMLIAAAIMLVLNASQGPAAGAPI